MKNKRIISIILSIAIVIIALQSNITSYADSASWMAESTKLPLNKQTQTLAIKPDGILNPTVYDSFYFYIPFKLRVNIVMKVKGSRSMYWKMYDASGKYTGGYSASSMWTYDRNTDTNTFSGWVDLEKGGYYLKFDMWGCGTDTFYVNFLLKTYVYTETRIQSIKAGKNRQITLKWNKAPGAEGYIIYRAAPGKGYAKIKQIKGNKASAVLKNVPKNKPYYYRVLAYRTVNGKKVYSAKWQSKRFVYKKK